MVNRVGPKDLQRLRPIFEGLRYNLVVDSILDGNTPAWVYADEVRQPQNFELGLATAPAFQGKGCANLTAAACVEHCLARDLTPQWYCWEDNIASRRVAEKVGSARPTRHEV
jgi:RimJ/RimL family protein N-acetyltransferase